MKISLQTDYTLRVLLYLAAMPDRHVSTAEIAGAYHISYNHLTKVVNRLTADNYLTAIRGRSGGVMLGRAPAEINIGQIVRATECEGDLVDCASCPIASACTLRGVLGEALRAFYDVLDRYTLADLRADRALARLLGQPLDQA